MKMILSAAILALVLMGAAINAQSQDAQPSEVKQPVAAPAAQNPPTPPAETPAAPPAPQPDAAQTETVPPAAPAVVPTAAMASAAQESKALCPVESGRENDPQAYEDLGEQFYTGTGKPKNYAFALSCFAYAAEQGLIRAQYRLGLMYSRGTQVERDYVVAYKWLSLAAAKDDAEAVAERDRVGKQLPPASREKAQKEAYAWWEAKGGK